MLYREQTEFCRNLFLIDRKYRKKLFAFENEV